MPIYTCEICGKNFYKKYIYEKHINKKYKCQIKTSNTNDNINNASTVLIQLMEKLKDFEDSNTKLITSLEKHNIELKKANDNKIDCLEKKSNENEAQINLLIEENKILREEIKKISDSKGSIVENNNNNNNNKTLVNKHSNNNTYIVINKFGTETDDHITEKEARKIMSRGYGAIPEYVNAVYYNKEKPENHNMYLPNWRDKTKVLIYDGNNWTLTHTEDVLDDIKSKGINFIQKKYTTLNNDNKVDSIIITKLKRFLDSYECEEKDKMDTLNDELCLLLYNGKTIIEKTRKRSTKKL